MTQAGSAGLAGLSDHLLDGLLSDDPFAATLLGVPGYDDRVPEVSTEAAQQRVAELRDLSDRAGRLTGLSADDALTREVLVATADDLAERIALLDVQFQTAPFMVSAHARVLSTMPRTRLTTVEAAQDYLCRLAAVPDFLAAVTTQLRTGVRSGRSPSARSLAGSVAALDAYFAGQSDPLTMPDWDEPTWRRERDALLAQQVRPALRAFQGFYRDELAPLARPDDQVGLRWIADGDAAYATYARSWTSTSLDPKELHELGLAEMDRLESEYERLGQRVFGIRDPRLVRARLREDPDLRLSGRDELMQRSRDALQRAAQALPGWFGALPPSECDLQWVAEHEAPHAAPAFYTPPDPSSGRPGTYWLNPHRVTERPRYDVEAIAFHEALPGHHLQLSLAQGLTALPLFRRINVSGSYTEGWGLYTEQLADEMGLYTSDLDRLGLLTCSSWRACRLVVDSGLHALGWSFQQAVEFMQEHTALAPSVVEAEVDRYVGLPGQALSYLVGRLEISRLRADAERRLGTRFDPRDFHDEVLRHGAVPLDVLEGIVGRWALARAS